jgi:hypothetical protein
LPATEGWQQGQTFNPIGVLAKAKGKFRFELRLMPATAGFVQAGKGNRGIADGD